MCQSFECGWWWRLAEAKEWIELAVLYSDVRDGYVAGIKLARWNY